MKKDEITKVSIEYMPVAEATWIDTFSALLTIVIAGVAVLIAYQQYKINQQRLRHETYDRRLAVYKAVQSHLLIIAQKNSATFEECSEFYTEASEAAFLFDSTVQDKIEEIYKESIRLTSIEQKLFPSDGVAVVKDPAERVGLAAEKEVLVNWHADELKQSKKFFGQKLGLLP